MYCLPNAVHLQMPACQNILTYAATISATLARAEEATCTVYLLMLDAASRRE